MKMTRRYLCELDERESIDDIFIASDKQLRPNRNGNLYLQVRLADRSGSCNAMMWNASERIYQQFENGDYVRVDGTTQYYNGNLQIVVGRIEPAEPGEVNEDDFITVSRELHAKRVERLSEILRSIQNFHLRNLAECCLIDDQFMDGIHRGAAGIKNHHAFSGGLLEHMVNLMEVVLLVGPRYPQLDGDLLLTGAFWHDVGKVREMTYDRHLSYTDEGQMLGHLILGVKMLEEKIVESSKLAGEEFPAELALQIKHMIVSHHGRYEYGSPKVPMTLEAIALHLLDDLDAKVHGFDQLIREDTNSDSSWTTYHPNLGRKLYKGNR